MYRAMKPSEGSRSLFRLLLHSNPRIATRFSKPISAGSQRYSWHRLPRHLQALRVYRHHDLPYHGAVKDLYSEATAWYPWQASWTELGLAWIWLEEDIAAITSCQELIKQGVRANFAFGSI